MSWMARCARGPRRWWLRYRRHADWMGAIVLSAVVIAGMTQSGTATINGKPPRAVDAGAVALALASSLPIAYRRRRPITVLGATAVAVTAYQLLRYPGSGQELGAVVAAYSVGAYSRNRRQVTRAAVSLLLGLTLLNIVHAIADHKTLESASNVVGNVIIFGAAFIMGDNVRRRRQRIFDLEERAAHETREREMLARQTVADEQRRIARELHDVVAHSLSVMVVQAGAARRVVGTRPDQAAEALGHIESTGRDALNEMRRLLGVLRGEGSTTMDPQPSLDQLDQLATADPSLPVRVAISGTPRRLPPSVDMQAFRIVQEALTNVRKHAGPARASVDIDYSTDHVQVTVADDGRGASVPDGAGHGLVGMRERVSLVGGTLQAGPRPGGGWLVRATLPVDGAPVADGATTDA